jgi:hypothetical protein
MTQEELQKLYGEATFHAKVWTARAQAYEQKLIELANQPAKEAEKKEPEK